MPSVLTGLAGFCRDRRGAFATIAVIMFSGFGLLSITAVDIFKVQRARAALTNAVDETALTAVRSEDRGQIRQQLARSMLDLSLKGMTYLHVLDLKIHDEDIQQVEIIAEAEVDTFVLEKVLGKRVVAAASASAMRGMDEIGDCFLATGIGTVVTVAASGGVAGETCTTAVTTGGGSVSDPGGAIGMPVCVPGAGGSCKGAGAVMDELNSLPDWLVGTCADAPTVFSNTSGTITLDPATYCGSLTVTAQDIVLNPGIYYFYGPIRFTFSNTLTANGVRLLMIHPNSALTFDGGVLNMTPIPTDIDHPNYGNVLIHQGGSPHTVDLAIRQPLVFTNTTVINTLRGAISWDESPVEIGYSVPDGAVHDVVIAGHSLRFTNTLPVNGAAPDYADNLRTHLARTRLVK